VNSKSISLLDKCEIENNLRFSGDESNSKSIDVLLNNIRILILMTVKQIAKKLETSDACIVLPEIKHIKMYIRN